MTATFQEILLDLFQQVVEDPDHIPAMPIEGIREDSQEQRLLANFRQMLECLQQSKQQTEAALREKEDQYRSIF